MLNKLILVITCLLCSCAQNDKLDSLYVQSTSAGTYDGHELTLNEVPNVIFFSKHTAGHLPLEQFANRWEREKEATLSIFREGGDATATLELSKPKVSANKISYQVKAVDGEIPRSFGHASLFIDFGKTCCTGRSF